MSTRHRHSLAGQRGMVLIASLLLLVVVTILAVSMFRSFGVQEKIAGNLREKGRAVHAAESAQQYAEYWLSLGNGNLLVACNGVLDANKNQGQVCQNQLPLSTDMKDVISLPWKIAGAEVGTDYTPPNPAVANTLMPLDAAGTTGGAGNYYLRPRFYISFLGLVKGGLANLYQVDAVGYGGTPNAVAVVESTYMVSTGVKDLGGL
jgi:type IV pilus assembly protein PilX